MCQFFSGIITKTKLFTDWDTDSHEEIISKNNLYEGDQNRPFNFVRVELLQKDNNIFNHDFDTWKLKIDQDNIPDWFDEKYTEQLMKEKLKELIDNRFIINKIVEKITDGRWFVIGGTIQNVRGGTIQDVIGGTIQNVRSGTIQNVRSGTIQNVIGGTIQDVFGGTIQNVIGGTIQNVRGGTIQDVIGGTIQNVWSGTIQDVRSGTIQNVIGGTIQNVWGGTIQDVIGGTIQDIRRNIKLIGFINKKGIVIDRCDDKFIIYTKNKNKKTIQLYNN